MQAIPYPDLTPLIGLHVPIYDLKETLIAGQAEYLEFLSYISDNTGNVRSTTLWMIILSSIFFIAGVVFFIMFKKN